jgi:hypothetical protein
MGDYWELLGNTGKNILEQHEVTNFKYFVKSDIRQCGI